MSLSFSTPQPSLTMHPCEISLHLPEEKLPRASSAFPIFQRRPCRTPTAVCQIFPSAGLGVNIVYMCICVCVMYHSGFIYLLRRGVCIGVAQKLLLIIHSHRITAFIENQTKVGHFPKRFCTWLEYFSLFWRCQKQRARPLQRAVVGMQNNSTVTWRSYCKWIGWGVSLHWQKDSEQWS